MNSTVQWLIMVIYPYCSCLAGMKWNIYPLVMLFPMKNGWCSIVVIKFTRVCPMVVTPEHLLFTHYLQMLGANSLIIVFMFVPWETKPWRKKTTCSSSKPSVGFLGTNHSAEFACEAQFKGTQVPDDTISALLVVEPTPLKHMSSSIGMTTFSIYGKKKSCSKPPTIFAVMFCLWIALSTSMRFLSIHRMVLTQAI